MALLQESPLPRKPRAGGAGAPASRADASRVSDEAYVIRLDNTVMGYDWGSRTAIAALQGRRVPSDAPEAELWIGTHAVAPSRVHGSDDSLADRIARSPESEL